jgi:hypothetical protein
LVRPSAFLIFAGVNFLSFVPIGDDIYVLRVFFFLIFFILTLLVLLHLLFFFSEFSEVEVTALGCFLILIIKLF